ncbi:MAG TPA: ankyrin repeat domain-containing protein [Gemmatimonas aurantiaca]|uniref:Uncharacterized protein n=2 Tax=Gemmatimonas aurantiaca TaxID=173480 RepID=C1ADG6_GEMAT|nr:ankyrin repeat domain-containing protein [Gemmatimonas aurantiaca]BAH40543.1 hypothetical protein GAU_3501 [Gemmatimonas aurantiaca T-27]HCT56434.1 ankyrin repeat domain-containing protein [Gemmatimonas aurantiaca]
MTTPETTPLLRALYEGRPDVAHRLAAAGPLALPEAAALGAVDAGQALLEAAGDVEETSPDGWPSLHLAAFFGHAAMVELLLKWGSDVNRMATSSQGNSALHAALAGQGNDAIVAALLAAGADANRPDVHAVRPVHLAAARGNIRALEQLADAGAQLDSPLPDGTNPATLARQRGHEGAATWLDQRAPAREPDVTRRSAVLAGALLLNDARRWPRMAAAQQTPPLPAEVVRDFVRAAHSDLAAVRSLIDARPTLVNACQDWGAGDFETAIGAASHMGRRDIAEVLLAAGARPDLFTHIVLGDFELLRAQLHRHPSLVRTKGPHGLTFEAHAKVTGHSDVIRQVADIVAEARAALETPR